MKYSIIPEAKKLEVLSDETCFELSGGVKINFDDALEPAYDELYTFIFEDMKMLPEESLSGEILFRKDNTLSDEGYRIEVKKSLVQISSKGAAGAFYAVQSLKQLLVCGSMKLPELIVEDSPSMKVRSFMLDSSRYFFEKKDVLAFFDIMALHKLNTFHWHITDDQGWRLELYNKLLLAQIGGFRAGTNFNRKPHGGFYSQLDIEEIVAYAKKKFIKIIPEIDSPGHVVSALAAYPELSCSGRKLKVATHSGVKYDVLCIGKESSFDFIFDVWDETIELFGADIVHLGGDEVPTERWKYCKHCQAKMKELGFTEEKQLHSYYINRLAKHLEEKGVKTIMWCSDENPAEYDDSIIQEYWGGEKTEKEFLEKAKNKQVFDACSSAFYFDLPYAYISLKDTFNYNIPENLFGVECCLWTEYVPDFEKAGQMIFPRIEAFSETAWNGNNKISYEAFYEKLESFCFLLSAYGYSYTKPSAANPNKLHGKLQGLWFERRQLHWQGLHNIIDNYRMKAKMS